jgi:hypothetical protein
VEELSTLISFLLSTKAMLPRGNLLLRLANGWAYDPVTGGAFRIVVTLNCQIERLSSMKTPAVKEVVTSSFRASG